MSVVIREVERQERRVLGAIEFVDATTGVRIDAPLQLQRARRRPAKPSPGCATAGLTCCSEWQPLAAHAEAFLAPPARRPSARCSSTAASRPGGRLPAARLRAWRCRATPTRRGAALPARCSRPQRVELMRSCARAARRQLVAARRAGGRRRQRRRASAARWSRCVRPTAARCSPAASPTGAARRCCRWPGVPITTWSNDPGAVVVTEIAVRRARASSCPPPACARRRPPPTPAGRPPLRCRRPTPTASPPTRRRAPATPVDAVAAPRGGARAPCASSVDLPVSPVPPHRPALPALPSEGASRCPNT